MWEKYSKTSNKSMKLYISKRKGGRPIELMFDSHRSHNPFVTNKHHPIWHKLRVVGNPAWWNMFRFFFRCGKILSTSQLQEALLAFQDWWFSDASTLRFSVCVCQVLGVGKVAVKLRGGAAKSGQVPTLQKMVVIVAPKTSWVPEV